MTTALSPPSPLEQVARPLLELMQSISGLETTFITQIDWDDQEQEVVYALNTAELQVTEGSVVDWSDSMCRWVFLSGSEQTSDVKGSFPGSLGAEKLGMQTFFAVPVLAEDRTIGTVCGASRQVVKINDALLAMMRLVARAIAVQLQTDQESKAHRDRANRAEVLALTDELTGLPNRRAFNSRTEQELARSGGTRATSPSSCSTSTSSRPSTTSSVTRWGIRFCERWRRPCDRDHASRM